MDGWMFAASRERCDDVARRSTLSCFHFVFLVWDKKHLFGRVGSLSPSVFTVFLLSNMFLRSAVLLWGHIHPSPMLWKQSSLCFLNFSSPFFSFSRVVKEEISDDSAKLPCFNGRVVSWVRRCKLVLYFFGQFSSYLHLLAFIQIFQNFVWRLLY